MNRLRDLLRGIRWLGLLSFIVLLLVVLTQPASYSDGFTLSVVMASTFFIVVATVAQLGILLRQRRAMNSGDAYVLRTSVRQGAIAGVTVVLLLVLQLLRVVAVIDIVLIAVLAVVAELYLSSRGAQA